MNRLILALLIIVLWGVSMVFVFDPPEVYYAAALGGGVIGLVYMLYRKT